MKDKLFKLDHRRLNAIEVITRCSACDHFYYWLKEKNPLQADKPNYSLKRLAKEFLGEFPGYYTKFVKEDLELAANIKIAKTPWLEGD